MDTTKTSIRPLGNIISILDHPPGERNASSLVFRRHLTRLHDEGYAIRSVCLSQYENLFEHDVPWETKFLPRTSKWNQFVDRWMFRANCRTWLEQLKSSLSSHPPDTVFGLLWGKTMELSMAVADEYDSKLVLFVHDNPYTRVKGVKKARALQTLIEKNIARADMVYAVSQRLLNAIGASPERSRVLLPIGAEGTRHTVGTNGLPSSCEFHKSRPVLAYAGTVYYELSEILKRIATKLSEIGWDLLVICNEKDRSRDESLWAPENIHHVPMFRTSEEARAFLRSTADALLVATSPAANYLRDSFPSKFIDFAQLEKPIVVVAPHDCALSDWAQSNDWPLYCCLDERNQLHEIVASLKNSQKIDAAEQAVRTVTQSEFNPSVIHRMLSQDLRRLHALQA